MTVAFDSLFIAHMFYYTTMFYLYQDVRLISPLLKQGALRRCFVNR